MEKKFPKTITLPEVKNKYIEILNQKVVEIKELNSKANYSFRIDNDNDASKEYIKQIHSKIDEINDAFKGLYKDEGNPIDIAKYSY